MSIPFPSGQSGGARLRAQGKIKSQRGLTDARRSVSPPEHHDQRSISESWEEYRPSIPFANQSVIEHSAAEFLFLHSPSPTPDMEEASEATTWVLRSAALLCRAVYGVLDHLQARLR